MVRYKKNIVDYIIRNLPTDNSDYMSYEFSNIGSMDDDCFPIKLLNALRRLMTLFNHDLPPCLQNSHLPLQKFERETRQACDIVYNAYKYSASGQRDKAFQLIYSFYFESGLFTNLLEDISPKTNLFRMRASNSYNLYTDSEMFHIPFEKSYLTENYRFSISGLPMLYFGSSIYGCWIETNQPDIEKANVALYQTSANVKCINLMLPEPNDTITRESLMLLPLILACRIPVKHPNASFKPEYVIPQIVTECLSKYVSDHELDFVLGIKYLSVKYITENVSYYGKENEHLYVNYAFPPIQYSYIGHCPILLSSFMKVRLTSLFYDTHISPQRIEIKTNEKERVYMYSTFRRLERWLETPQMLWKRTDKGEL
jgi:hypothetical protein